MHRGYIKLWRSLDQTAFFRDSYAVHLAVYLLIKANHQPSKTLFNKELLEIKRGQCITGRFALAQATGINPSTIREKLDLLRKLNFLDIKSTNKFSLITIIKYRDYQSEEEKNDSTIDNKMTTKCQQNDTNNNDKNNKNDKKHTKYIVRFEKPKPEQVQEYALSIGYASLNPQAFCSYYESKGWLVGKSPMKDWQAAVRTWHAKDKQDHPQPKEKQYGFK